MDKLNIDFTNYDTKLTEKFKKRSKYVPVNHAELKSIIPGTINEVFVKDGQRVKEGDRLLILEAMKMKNALMAERDGVVKEVKVEKGDMVPKNYVLIVFE